MILKVKIKRLLALANQEIKLKSQCFGVDTDLYKKKSPIFSRKNIFIGSNRKFEKIYDIKTLLFAARELCAYSSNINF